MFLFDDIHVNMISKSYIAVLYADMQWNMQGVWL